MRFGFNDQTGHLTRHGLVSPWVDFLRVPVPVNVGMDVIDAYMSIARGGVVIFCLYDTNSRPDASWFTSLALEIRQRHPSAIIEVFNEPNLTLHGAPYPEDVRDVVEQVVYVLDGYAVIGPAMAPVAGWQPYFRTVYEHRNFQPSLHLYPNQTNWQKQTDAHISLALEYSGGGPWHVTEFGMGREYYPGEAFQAAKTVDLYKKIAAKGAAHAVCHSLTRLPGEWEDRMKLWAVKNDGTLTAIGRALKAERT